MHFNSFFVFFPFTNISSSSLLAITDSAAWGRRVQKKKAGTLAFSCRLHRVPGPPNQKKKKKKRVPQKNPRKNANLQLLLQRLQLSLQRLQTPLQPLAGEHCDP